jgi:hypothetical protein
LRRLRRFSLCQAAEELLVTGIRLLRLRAVGAAHLEVAEAAELLLPRAAGLRVVVAAVEPHLLAAATVAAAARLELAVAELRLP